jgi:hypothetical protein
MSYPKLNLNPKPNPNPNPNPNPTMSYPKLNPNPKPNPNPIPIPNPTMSYPPPLCDHLSYLLQLLPQTWLPKRPRPGCCRGEAGPGRRGLHGVGDSAPTAASSPWPVGVQQGKQGVGRMPSSMLLFE